MLCENVRKLFLLLKRKEILPKESIQPFNPSEYEGKWIARSVTDISGVIAHSTDVAEVFTQAESYGKEFVICYIPRGYKPDTSLGAFIK